MPDRWRVIVMNAEVTGRAALHTMHHACPAHAVQLMSATHLSNHDIHTAAALRTRCADCSFQAADGQDGEIV